MLKDNLKIGSLAIVAIALSAFTGCGDNNDDATAAAPAENTTAATTPATEAATTNPADADNDLATDNAGDDTNAAAGDDQPAAETATTIAPEALPAPAATVPVALYENDDEFTAAGTNFSARFSKATGTLSGLVYAGKTLIDGDNGPKLNAFRAVINNDAWSYEKWFHSGLFDLRHA
ncbi:MAG: beta-galactosidase small subunit, partial [Opitutae bacterium]|nr:beta-galactosidase small subunit [Opitutae bacterium]